MRAFVAEKRGDEVVRGVRDDFEIGDLGEGDVLVKVGWSSVNYKDALATIAKGQVARISPLIPGIDLAGVDEDSGEEVLAHGYDLGVAHHGGYAECARVRSEWVVPLPGGLSAKQAMTIGTAGYTAARCVIALEDAGLTPDSGPVLVTGASGGVGSTAVDILAARGYEVVASSGKDPEYLELLGASEVITREDAAGDAGRPLEKARWAGAVDCVGGEVLAGVIRSLHYGGAVAACGNTGGVKLPATVLPFILRGVSLLGVDSVQTPIKERTETWRRLATDLRPPHLDDSLGHETDLDGLEDVLSKILRGEVSGRTVVRL
ncbi:acryloyl-CoA reductase [Solirubrobacter ginsenosidimutans]|uniref:Acryloyl-CoA reductase n=1 Tax=Solirubrobacter ginsenosidimutans TaxID=490573 RepID=A0A9X3MY92_9ACTN|nr:acryloyl-CoA reductase [Solirubrobacter ginsenosidimutans]MDA0163841.1 acryloyl-CoA reductase [Solirubrobacter ginsenosidimutans]